MRPRKILGGVALAAAAVLSLSACAGGDASGGGAEYRIGVSQFVQHPALDAATAGFQRAFEEAGLNVSFDVQNANAEQSTATTIAGKFASDDTDLVLAVATPAAQSAAQAVTGKPVLFTAVTDPVEAGLVDSLEAPGRNVTGTTDLNPVAEQIGLIREVLPQAKTVGVVYSSGEVNSEVQLGLAREAAKGLGLEIKEVTITSAGELSTALSTLGDVDAIYVPTDNRVTEGVATVVEYAETNRVPLFAAEENTVEAGAVATLGLDYEQLGYQTGQMAIRILTEGADPASMPVEEQSEFLLSINPAAAQAQGVTIPEALVQRADQTFGEDK
ncbi:MAG: ABC transporter substrate-binding protein [Pseudoclavibacter sp.]|nr:ABC transporter substrate-binding protein [Pseudoclavibacter sp.]